MSLLFTMWKTLVTLSLASILQVEILDIAKLSRYVKGYFISQNF